MQEHTFGKSHSWHLGVDGVEDALIANLRLGDEADLGAQVRDASASAGHDHWSLGLSKTETTDIKKEFYTFHKMDDKSKTGKKGDEMLVFNSLNTRSIIPQNVLQEGRAIQ